MRTTTPPVPWRDVIRFAITVPTPLAAALLAGGGVDDKAALGAGVFATTGALAATLAPRAGPLRENVRRIAATTLLGGLGLVIGQYATGGGRQPVVVIAVVSAIAALISAINVVLSLGALQLLVYMSLASGLRSPLPAWAEVGFFVAGAAWATLTTLLQSLEEHRSRPRQRRRSVQPHRRSPHRLGHRRRAGGQTAADGGAQCGLRPGDPQPQPVRRAQPRALRAGRRAELGRRPGGGRRRLRPGELPPDPVDIAAVRSLAAALNGSGTSTRGGRRHGRRAIRPPVRSGMASASSGTSSATRRSGPAPRPSCPPRLAGGCAHWPIARSPAPTAAPSRCASRSA